ncbi:hypothetical protein C8J48_2561 [Desmospora activa DSM 45169]|uniref:Uncharacterized protein n=1 Tax=Desmospora activa DSM 45169 TaxID=1121389 RepID=A0A2T4ZDE5_9BACL|nr:hypothetical protein C8J48_2561 [Desmospora activa DSM 45169]
MVGSYPFRSFAEGVLVFEDFRKFYSLGRDSVVGGESLHFFNEQVDEKSRSNP